MGEGVGAQRKYSLHEIDVMRYALSFCESSLVREQMLRTYMFNGTDPAELEQKAARIMDIPLEEFRQWNIYPKPYGDPDNG